MATVSSTSAIDVNSIVSSLMSVEKQPLTFVANQKSAFEAKLSACGALKGEIALSHVSTSVGALLLLQNSTRNQLLQPPPRCLQLQPMVAPPHWGLCDYCRPIQRLKSQKIALDGVANTTDVIGTGKLTIAFEALCPGDCVARHASQFYRQSGQSFI